MILRAPALYKEAVNICGRLVVSGVHCVEGLGVLQEKTAFLFMEPVQKQSVNPER